MAAGAPHAPLRRAAHSRLVLLALVMLLGVCTLTPQVAHAVGLRERLRTRGGPTPTSVSEFPPEVDGPEQVKEPITTLMPRPPAPQPSMSNFGDEFPLDPPSPAPSSQPPPLAPSGRWLHTAVLIDGKMYVYGGVGSYSTALYNDLWLFNFVESKWTSLQASFVPPFPMHKQAGSGEPTTMSQFRPPDTPPAPPLEEQPDNGPIEVPLNPSEPAKEPIVQPKKTDTLPVIDMVPIPDVSPIKPPGFSFLELEATVSSRSKATATAKTSVSMELLMKHRTSVESRATSKSTEDPPTFWRSSNLAPELMSPFISADLWSYDLDTKLWSNVRSASPNVPAPRWLHSSVVVNNNMLVFGGVSYSDVILGDLWLFKPVGKEWLRASPTGEPPLPREGHSAVIMRNSAMFVFGGISYGHVPFNDMWLYDSTRNQWTVVDAKGTKPPPRWLHTATVFKDDAGTEKMIVFGGVTRNWVPLDDLYIFDAASLTWQHPKTKSYPPFPRMMHIASMIHSKLYIHGGIANNIPLEDTYYYDLLTNEWNEETPTGVFPYAREGHSAVVVEPIAPTFEPKKPEEWQPPPPPTDGRDPLTPLLKKGNYILPRPAERLRKEYNSNRFILVFGGAGPKPK